MFMENENHSTEVSEPNTQAQQSQINPRSVIPNSEVPKRSSKKKKVIALAVVTTMLLLVGAGITYALLVYIPSTNKPEDVLKKALDTFTLSPGSYTISGRLDQGGPNDPDFDYSIITDSKNNSSIEVHVSTFLQQPNVFVQSVNGKQYVRFTGFEDSKKLASHYSNGGEKGIQEYIAEFTDESNLSPNQDQWLELGDYILSQPEAQKTDNTKTKSLEGAILSLVGEKETVNGQSTQKFEITLTGDSFKKLLGQVDESARIPALSSIFPKGGIIAEQVKVTVWVNLKTKAIEQLSYAGRPFPDATFSLKVMLSGGAPIEAPKAEKLTNKLDYGVVSSVVFNKKFQHGDSDLDRERIADLKGIKTALEIYKARTGHYPDRYEMSVTQESFIGDQMPGADFELFKDPNGRFIGRNGSQYAYVSALANDSQDCGRFSKPCEKFFIITTLDNGKDYQLNSD